MVVLGGLEHGGWWGSRVAAHTIDSQRFNAQPVGCDVIRPISHLDDAGQKGQALYFAPTEQPWSAYNKTLLPH